MTSKVQKAMIGQRAEIATVCFDRHKHMIGKTGTIRRAIASRNVYEIRLDDKSLWDALPENVLIQMNDEPIFLRPQAD